MSNLTCPGCGSVYPLASVRNLDQFQCAVCHERIVVPMAGPSPQRMAPPPPVRQSAPPPPPPPPQPAAFAPPPVSAHAPASRRPAAPSRRDRREGAPKSGGPNVGLVAMGVAVAAMVVMVFVYVGGRKEPPPPAAPAKPAPAPVPPAPVKPEPPKADPMKDVEAWKALPASERATRTTNYINALDPRNGDQLSSAFSFFRARGDTDAMKRVAELELARDPSTGWARTARGDAPIGEIVDRCLADCVRAEEADTPSVRRLAAIAKAKRPERGTWWATADEKQEIETLLTGIRADQKRLADPFEWAVAKWDVYQRRIEVMRDFPSLSDVAGPYLVFAQLKAPPGTPIDQVGAVEVARARRVIDQTKTVLTAAYDGFFTHFGDALGLTRYDRTNLDEKTVQKVNVFPDEATWKRYHERLGQTGWPDNYYSYYDSEEPRFVITYDVTGEEAVASERSKARSAIYQLLHFYAWDATRKSGGGELAFAQCRSLPIGIETGIANGFAAYRRDGTAFVWLQADTAYMKGIWVYTQVLAKKRWAMWSLDELLSAQDWQDLDARATRRAVPKPAATLSDAQNAEVKTAVRLFRTLFQAKSWSLFTYLNTAAGPDGRLLHRDRFLAFLRGALRIPADPARPAGAAIPRVGTGEFRAAMGLASPAEFAAFERGWLAWEAATFPKSADATWQQHLDEWMRSLGGK